jgi:hypothetical protein
MVKVSELPVIEIFPGVLPVVMPATEKVLPSVPDRLSVLVESNTTVFADPGCVPPNQLPSTFQSGLVLPLHVIDWACPAGLPAIRNAHSAMNPIAEEAFLTAL